jgi:hypothetical protein
MSRRLTRTVVWIAACPGCAAIGFVLALWCQAAQNQRSVSPQPPAPTVEQVRQLATLVSSRVEVADVQVTRIEGHTGAVRAVLIVRGDLLLGTDLSRARLEAVDPARKSAVLVLPPPAVTSPRVNHDRTRLFGVSESGLWQLTPGDAAQTAAVNEAYAQAQRLVAAAGSDPALLDRSRPQTERLVASFFEALGWHVTVRWSTD